MTDPTAPDALDLEAIVIEALERLPAPFRERLGNVAIVIEDEPTPDQLASVGARGLYGLYQGVPRTVYGADAAIVPNKITIFRGPLTRANPTPERLTAAVDRHGPSRDRPSLRDQRPATAGAAARPALIRPGRRTGCCSGAWSRPLRSRGARPAGRRPGPMRR